MNDLSETANGVSRPTGQDITRLPANPNLRFVFHHARALIQGAPAPEMPDLGNGAAWMHDLETVLAPLMPRPEDRNRTRVRHYLAILYWGGFLCIDADEEFVWVPKGAQQ